MEDIGKLLCAKDEPKNPTRIEIVREVLTDLCDRVSVLTHFDTKLESTAVNGYTSTIGLEHHSATSQCGGNGTAVMVTTELGNDSELSCNGDNESAVNNNINGEFVHLTAEVPDPTGLVSKTNEISQREHEQNAESCESIKPLLLGISGDTTCKITNNNCVLHDGEPSQLSILCSVGTVKTNDCQLTDETNDCQLRDETNVAHDKMGFESYTGEVEHPDPGSTTKEAMVPSADVSQNTGVDDKVNKAVKEKETSSSWSRSDSETSSSSGDSSSDESGPESIIASLKISAAKLDLDEEDDDDKIKMPPKTKDEVLISELPPPAPVDIVVDEKLEIKPLGEIESILKESSLVIIKSFPNSPALDSDSILFFEDRCFFGQVFDIFGQVKSPHYCVRFDSEDHVMDEKLHVGQHVYYAPDATQLTNFVFMSQVRSIKGSDASWQDDQEPPSGLIEYSDDEAEKEAKSAKKKGKKQKKIRSSNNRHMDGQQCFQQPPRNWQQRDRGHEHPQAQRPALFPRPNFGFQQNQPLQNQYPPPLPGQPRHPYNEYEYRSSHFSQQFGYSLYPIQQIPLRSNSTPYYQQHLSQPLYQQPYPHQFQVPPPPPSEQAPPRSYPQQYPPPPPERAAQPYPQQHHHQLNKPH